MGKRMHGSVRKLQNSRGFGRILGENGRDLCFDETCLDALDLRALSIGDWVEYQEQYRAERVRAVKVRSIAGSRIGSSSRS